jgi:ABC-type dipeptide/oligopeptide/nickel transport system permease component
MWIYIARRLLWLPFLLLAASLITFSLGRFGPGDPVRVMMGNRYDEQVAARIRHEMGLDRSFSVQYLDYIWGFARGDFGVSFRYVGQPVRDIILPKMWVSARLALAAMAISLGVGLPLGFFIAHKQGRWQDPMSVTLAVVFMAIPVMVSVPTLLWLLCLKLNVAFAFDFLFIHLDVDYGGVPCSGWGGLFDQRIIVPAITMGVPGIAGLTRLMRASTLDVLNQDFVRTAQSKGLNQLTIDTRHVFRNAMIPIVTILAFSLAGLIGGAFITETILGIPGIGRFVVQSIFDRDYPVIMAVTLLGASAFVLANLLADVAYASIDPRIRYQ